MPSLKDASIQAGGSLMANWVDGQSAVFGAYWLRDNCRCAQCRHPSNGQKLYQIMDLPAQLAVRTLRLVDGLTMELTWSDGHVSVYGSDWLAAHQLGMAARQARRIKPMLWDQSLAADMPVTSWPALLADPARELAWLERYTALGFGLLTDVQITPGAVADVGDRLGYVRITNYGQLFDVKSVPNPTNLAYTAVALGVHSDNPYRHPSPGVQLLHCLEAEAPGGDTLLVDGFAAAELLRQQDPAAFELLRKVPMNFRYADAHTDLRARQT
ncbi:MAG: TauD/TfdA family dioxygenase, partial [Betaproteobacteria bacterium]